MKNYILKSRHSVAVWLTSNELNTSINDLRLFDGRPGDIARLLFFQQNAHQE